MSSDESSENVVLSVGAGVMSMMVVYALATDVFGLDKPRSRVLVSIALAIAAAAGVARYVRLCRLGTKLSFFEPQTILRQDQAKYWFWLLAAAAVGAYSVYEILMGGSFLGTLGCLASVSSTFVLGRSLLRPFK